MSDEQEALSENEAEVLYSMQSVDWWQRPMDCGGYDSSHHSHTLRRLARRGLVEMVTRGLAPVDPQKPRGGPYLYKITSAGEAAIVAYRLRRNE